jgi:4-amino-4-deoxy-L-arabinose transferase-like glycosyltransferase
MLSESSPATPATRLAFWKEREFWWLLLLVVVAYSLRLTDLTIRGEETRRALVAREMLQTGDWVVPRTQGQPLYSRPPLQNWLIAGIATLQGTIDEFSVRLPSLLSILATVALLYAYSRGFLSRLGALCTGLVFASLGQVIELGRTGETDAMFTLLVAGSLLLWHLGFVRGWSPWLTWMLGYGCAALGTLTKGPQAPVYFTAIVGMTLLLNRRVKLAFQLPHVGGLALYALVVGAWQIPFMLRAGSSAGGEIYVMDVGHRFLDATWGSFFEHFAQYPLELWACLLPWSVLFLVWTRPGFRASLAGTWPQVGFQLTALAVAFPSVWLPPGSRPRYFMALYPCVAILVGTTLDRLAHASAETEWRRLWPHFVRGCALVIGGVGLALAGVSLIRPDFWLSQSLPFAGFHLAACGLAAAALWRWSESPGEVPLRRCVTTIAAFVVACQLGVLTNAHQKTTPDTVEAVQQLKQLLPPGAKLYSMDLAHHMFVHHYGEVHCLPWPKTASEIPADLEYLCVDSRWQVNGPLPLDWEQIFWVPCTKHRVQKWPIGMIIGRRKQADESRDMPGDAFATAGLDDQDD